MSKIPLLLITGLCASLGVSLSASAEEREVFRTINSDGTVEFSDHGNAKSSTVFKIRKPVVVARPPGSSFQNNYNEDPETETTTQEGQTSAYKDFQILTPTNNEGGWFNGEVQVKVALTPQLKSKHEVVIQLNGTELTAGAKLNYSLPEVHRGLHTLQVSVRNKADGVILNTDTVDFQVHRQSAKSNTRKLHSSLQTETTLDPSDINAILSE